MSLRFVVVHEAEADFATATELADRALLEAIHWLDEHMIVSQREWVIEDSSGGRLTWSSIPRLARELGITARGHFNGIPGDADAAAARRAILYIRKVLPDVSAIVLIRDSDDQPERRRGLEQARNNASGGIVIVLGLAIVERESWVISGFDPLNDEEKTRLEAERSELGFNPCEKSHELIACKNDAARRSPKRVLRQLSGSNHDRERHCWSNTSLDLLRQRGERNGLAAYLREVHEHLAPLIGHVPRGEGN